MLMWHIVTTAARKKKRGQRFFALINAYAIRKVLIYINCNKLQGLVITGKSPAVFHAVEA